MAVNMAFSFQINPVQSRDWALICEFDGSKFGEVTSQILSNDRKSPRASQLLDNFVRATSDEAFSKALCRQLLSLSGFRRARNLAPDDAIEALILSFESHLAGEDIYAWLNEQKQSLTKLLASETIRLPAKSLQLSTDHSALFASANVVTDVRPVFDGDRNAVEGGIIIQTLRLHYFEGGEEKDVSIALDVEDLKNVIAELEKAKNKAETTRKLFTEKTGMDIFIVGEESYGFS